MKRKNNHTDVISSKLMLLTTDVFWLLDLSLFYTVSFYFFGNSWGVVMEWPNCGDFQLHNCL